MTDRTQGAGGRETSIRNGIALEALERAVEHLRFPLAKDALLDKKGGMPLRLGSDGSEIPLREILEDVNIELFSSAAHVREVVNLSWKDWASLRRGDYGSG